MMQEEDRTQDVTFQVQSSRSTVLEGSLIYEFASTNSIGIFANRSKGDNLGIPDNPALLQAQAFDESEYGVRVNWKTEGKWDIASYVAHHIRDGQTYSARNFSGTVGDLNVVYTLSGRTRLEFDVNRHLYSSADLFGSYFEASEAKIGLAYDLTGKVVLRPQYDIVRQRYDGSPFPTDNLLAEKTQYATLRLDYAALRSVDVAALISHSRRTSTLSSLEYKNNSAIPLRPLQVLTFAVPTERRRLVLVHRNIAAWRRGPVSQPPCPPNRHNFPFLPRLRIVSDDSGDCPDDAGADPDPHDDRHDRTVK